MGDDNPDGAEDEKFLWSLGVGDKLPEWLKDQRTKERARGQNQEPRRSGDRIARPGIGPQRVWSDAESLESTAKRVTSTPSAAPKAAPAAPAPTTVPRGEAAPVQPPSEARPTAPAARPTAAPPQQPQRAEPDDGKAYPGDGLRTKAKEPPAIRKFNMNMKDWLMSLDDSGFLAQYHDGIAAKLDSLEQLVDVYVKDGELDKQFFSDTGIKKLGHKRLFEKWFKDNCSN